MQLRAGMPCSTAAAAAETERGAEEVLEQPSSSTESPAGTHPTLFIPGSEHTQMYIHRYTYSTHTTAHLHGQ